MRRYVENAGVIVREDVTANNGAKSTTSSWIACAKDSGSSIKTARVYGLEWRVLVAMKEGPPGSRNPYGGPILVMAGWRDTQ
jgi:hypothetical protein